MVIRVPKVQTSGSTPSDADAHAQEPPPPPEASTSSVAGALRGLVPPTGGASTALAVPQRGATGGDVPSAKCPPGVFGFCGMGGDRESFSL